MSNSTTEPLGVEPGIAKSGPLFYKGEPFEAWIPAHLSTAPSLAQALYLLIQRSEEVIRLVRRSGPITGWFEIPSEIVLAMFELERASLADVSRDCECARLRTHDEGRGRHEAWICSGDRLDGIVEKIESGQWSRRKGLVYVMATNPTEGPFKVGRTVDIEQRQRAIQNMNGGDLQVLRKWVSFDYVEDEKRMHVELDDYRRHGEWFGCDLSLIDATAESIGLVAQ